MEKYPNDIKDKERTLNFALLVQQIIGVEGIKYNIQSQNQGISDTDIILIVECWLEKVKDNFKKGIKDNIFFKGQEPPK